MTPIKNKPQPKGKNMNNTIDIDFKDVVIEGMDFSTPLEYGKLHNIVMGSGQGKTLTSLKIAQNLNHAGFNVAFIVGDEGIEGVGRRLAGLVETIKDQDPDYESWGSLIVDDAVVNGDFDLEKLRWIMEHNNDVVIIDSPYAERKAAEIEELVKHFNMVGIMTKQASRKAYVPAVDVLDTDDLVSVGSF